MFFHLDDPFGQPLPVPILRYRVKSWLERSDMKEIMGDDDGSKESDGIGYKGLTRKLNVTKKSKVTPTLTHVPDKTYAFSRTCYPIKCRKCPTLSRKCPINV